VAELSPREQDRLHRSIERFGEDADQQS
jgi:hypothetical protein